ncbi:MAG TPA: 2Fe-2S iron-sulfur cluster-binding protein [Jatrophihabitans sp.]|nr:2Fe-2S iron-sulfur cluster-binding protein [Jatrophihabitans sp.]
MSTFHKLTVSAIAPLTDQAVAVEFSVPEPLRDDYAFRPGQHLTLRRVSGDLEDRRTYSICSTPRLLAESGRLRIGVKRVPDGVFSGWLTAGLQPGEVIEVMTPAGHFGTDVPATAPRTIGCIAAGSGITPVLSIATSVLEAEPGSEVLLVYGNRSSAQVMFLEPLADLKNRFPDRLTLLHVLSAEPQLSDLLTGRIDAGKIATLLSNPALPAGRVSDWFLCGPFGMVTAARDALVSGGVAESAVHAELFYVGDAPDASAEVVESADDRGAASAVTVTLAGRTSTMAVPFSGPSILDAVLASRPDAPYACKGGVCGTCRARVVEGEVRMTRNYALEPDEIAAGLVLACQSHPVSDSVQLEFR